MTYAIDANGILNVSARDLASGRSKAITITQSDRGALSKDDIAKLVADAEANATEDAAARERVLARNALEQVDAESWQCVTYGSGFLTTRE